MCIRDSIYSVKEIQEYVKNKKNLTTGQLELILKKNKIAIPKEFKTSFIKENIFKPINKFKNNVTEFKEDQIKAKNKFFRKTQNFKYDSQRKINLSLKNLWNNLGKIGLNFLNIIPMLGKTFYGFFANSLTELFNGIYNQQINPKNAKTAIIGIFVIVGITTLVINGLTNYETVSPVKKVEIQKQQTNVKKVEKKIEKKVNKKKKIKPLVKKKKKQP